MSPLALNLALLIIGVVVLLRTSVYLVRSLSAVARFLGFSEFVLSFVLLSVATSLPELAVGVSSSVSGVAQLSLGDIFGSNIVNLSLILGMVAILGNGLKLKDYKHYKSGRIYTFLFAIIPFGLVLDGTLTRIDGALLLGLFVFNMIRILRERKLIIERKVWRPSLRPHTRHIVSSRPQFASTLITLLISVPVLLGAAQLIVHSIRNISTLFNLPEFILGLFLISIGTSLPELFVAIRSVKLHKVGVSLGDIFGTVYVNATLILGIVALIHPVDTSGFGMLGITAIFTVLIMLLTFAFLWNKNYLVRREGVVLLLVYALFLIFQFTLLAT